MKIQVARIIASALLAANPFARPSAANWNETQSLSLSMPTLDAAVPSNHTAHQAVERPGCEDHGLHLCNVTPSSDKILASAKPSIKTSVRANTRPVTSNHTTAVGAFYCGAQGLDFCNTTPADRLFDDIAEPLVDATMAPTLIVEPVDHGRIIANTTTSNELFKTQKSAMTVESTKEESSHQATPWYVIASLVAGALIVAVVCGVRTQNKQHKQPPLTRQQRKYAAKRDRQRQQKKKNLTSASDKPSLKVETPVELEDFSSPSPEEDNATATVALDTKEVEVASDESAAATCDETATSIEEHDTTATEAEVAPDDSATTTSDEATLVLIPASLEESASLAAANQEEDKQQKSQPVAVPRKRKRNKNKMAKPTPAVVTQQGDRNEVKEEAAAVATKSITHQGLSAVAEKPTMPSFAPAFTAANITQPCPDRKKKESREMPPSALFKQLRRHSPSSMMAGSLKKKAPAATHKQYNDALPAAKTPTIAPKPTPVVKAPLDIKALMRQSRGVPIQGKSKKETSDEATSGSELSIAPFQVCDGPSPSDLVVQTATELDVRGRDSMRSLRLEQNQVPKPTIEEKKEKIEFSTPDAEVLFETAAQLEIKEEESEGAGTSETSSMTTSLDFHEEFTNDCLLRPTIPCPSVINTCTLENVSDISQANGSMTTMSSSADTAKFGFSHEAVDCPVQTVLLEIDTGSSVSSTSDSMEERSEAFDTAMERLKSTLPHVNLSSGPTHKQYSPDGRFHRPHSQTHPPHLKTQEPCIYHAQGCCWFGDNCTNSHDIVHDESANQLFDTMAPSNMANLTGPHMMCHPIGYDVMPQMVCLPQPYPYIDNGFGILPCPMEVFDPPMFDPCYAPHRYVDNGPGMMPHPMAMADPAMIDPYYGSFY